MIFIVSYSNLFLAVDDIWGIRSRQFSCISRFRTPSQPIYYECLNQIWLYEILFFNVKVNFSYLRCIQHPCVVTMLKSWTYGTCSNSKRQSSIKTLEVTKERLDSGKIVNDSNLRKHNLGFKKIINIKYWILTHVTSKYYRISDRNSVIKKFLKM